MAAPVEVTQLLLHAQDPDPNIRTLAEQKIASFQEHDYPGFLASLAAELSSSAKPADSRRLAGLVLKNTLDAKDEARKAELQARWGAVDASLKNKIREALLATLQMEPQDVRHTAALVVAKVAAIDLPRNEWPTLIAALLANMSATPPQHGVRQATLEVLGYVCEEMATVNEDVLAREQINMILTAVVSGMRADEPSDDARLAAMTAMQNAIEFAEHNFENDNERNYIMQARRAQRDTGECMRPSLVARSACTWHDMQPLHGRGTMRRMVHGWIHHRCRRHRADGLRGHSRA
jgi:importin subunit beta-1